MVGYMNRESLRKTLETDTPGSIAGAGSDCGKRARRQATSSASKTSTDCDQDTLLIQVTQEGPGACHEGYHSCFHYGVTIDGGVEGENMSAERTFDPESVWLLEWRNT